MFRRTRRRFPPPFWGWARRSVRWKAFRERRRLRCRRRLEGNVSDKVLPSRTGLWLAQIGRNQSLGRQAGREGRLRPAGHELARELQQDTPKISGQKGPSSPLFLNSGCPKNTFLPRFSERWWSGFTPFPLRICERRWSQKGFLPLICEIGWSDAVGERPVLNGRNGGIEAPKKPVIYPLTTFPIHEFLARSFPPSRDLFPDFAVLPRASGPRFSDALFRHAGRSLHQRAPPHRHR